MYHGKIYTIEIYNLDYEKIYIDYTFSHYAKKDKFYVLHFYILQYGIIYTWTQEKKPFIFPGIITIHWRP